MLKKNCHQVLGSQKSKLTPLELVFQTAGAINPPPYKDRVKGISQIWLISHSLLSGESYYNILIKFPSYCYPYPIS